MSNIINTKLVIIGAGPAGYTAAIYAARSCIEVILICGSQKGGQLTITTDVENYPGFASTIQGPWLMEQMELQVKHLGVQIVDDTIKVVDFHRNAHLENIKYENNDNQHNINNQNNINITNTKTDITNTKTDSIVHNNKFKLFGESGNLYTSDAVIIATGAEAKWLNLETEKKFQGYGVSGCATCDGFFYKGKRVIVVGGGNTAVEEALYLTNHANEIILIHRRDQLRAEKIMQNKLFKHPKIKIIWNSVIEEIIGTENPMNVTGVKINNIKTKEIQNIQADGVFIAIGHKPNTDIFKSQITLDDEGYIVISESHSTKTNIPGIFVAGDASDKKYRQAVTAAGTGCMAAIDAEKYLQSLIF